MYSSPFSARNLLTQITYPNGSIVDRTFTARAQLQQTSYNTNMVATLQYDPGLRESQRTFGNNIVTTRSYNRADNLVTAINTTADAALSFAYTYDANKNPTSETTGGVMANYSWTTPTGGYDNEDRLTNWQRSLGFTQVWNLSLVGDWNTNTVNGNAETRTHNDVHEILTVVPGQPQTTLLHDAKGNLSRDEKNQTYTWDYNNHQSQAVTSGGAGETWTYTYDALGRRVSKSVTTTAKIGTPGSVGTGTGTTTTTTTTVYVCLSQTVQGKPAGQEIAEYNANFVATNPLRMYVFGEYIDEPLAQITPQGLSYTTHYYHQNRQYCVTAMTDNTGAVIERYAYTAYGVTTILAPDGVTPRATSLYANSYLFTGRRFDPETGNYYFRARYHSPSLGRFIGRDPLGYMDGTNLYAAYYAMWSGVDPQGLGLWKWLYTGDWNASDEVYDVAVQAAGDFIYENSPIRGGYVAVTVASDSGKLGGGNSIDAQVNLQGTWTMDTGYGAGATVTGGIDTGSGLIGVGGELNWSEDTGWTSGGGIGYSDYRSTYRFPRNSDTKSGIDFGISSDGTILLGLGRGPISGGFIIDPSKFKNLFNVWADMIGSGSSCP